jgi:hypothetical protein
MRPARWLIAGLLLAGCSAEARKPSERAQAVSDTASVPAELSEWLISSRGSGGLTGQTSETDLRQRYGSDAVVATRIELGEGETAPGTALFGSDSLRRLEIIWRDSLAREQPARAILRGHQSRWRVGPGISLGTSLQELERLNGRPFTLAGFGWDYAGVVTDWNGGALDRALAGVKLYLDPGPAQYESAPYSQVLGDRDYTSSLPAMQQLSPRVGQIFVDFE